YAAGAGCRAELEEVEADAVLGRPGDMVGGDAGLAGVVGDEPAERVVGQARHPGGAAAEAAEADGGVQLGAADLDVEAARLLQAAELRRAQPDHGLAEGDDVIRHGGRARTGREGGERPRDSI